MYCIIIGIFVNELMHSRIEPRWFSIHHTESAHQINYSQLYLIVGLVSLSVYW